MPRERRGVAAAEALVSLLLALTLVGLGWRALSRQRTVAGRLVHQMDAMSARRMAVTVIGRDFRQGVAGRDWPDPVGDSLPLRAFRGWALRCPEDPGRPGGVVVAYRGDRSPNPAKDSVLVLTPQGWHPTDLVRRAGTTRPSCPGGLDFDTELWTLEPPAPGVLMRVFERGSYHLAEGALRYRRGRGGRQPLTPEVFVESSALGGSRGRLLLRLATDREAWGGATWSTEVSLWSRETTRGGREE